MRLSLRYRLLGPLLVLLALDAAATGWAALSAADQAERRIATQLRGVAHTLTVSGDTELISAPAYYLAAQRAPSVNAYMTGIAIIQDDSDLLNAPAAMAQFRALGATTVRVFLPWAELAPDALQRSGHVETSAI